MILVLFNTISFEQYPYSTNESVPAAFLAAPSVLDFAAGAAVDEYRQYVAVASELLRTTVRKDMEEQ